jgi:F-type H+-transporting ATPase subunit epsilon
MPDKVVFTLVSPEQLIFSQPVDMVVIPGEKGDFGVLPHHAALIAVLRAGLVHIYEQNNIIQQIFISGGFANVNEQGCTVLSEECILLEDLQKQDLESQLAEIQIDLELAETEEDQKVLQHNLEVTRTKLSLVRRLS